MFDLNNEVGRTFCSKEFNNLKIAQQNQMVNDAGYKPLNSDHKLKQTSFQNYTTKLAMTSELSQMKPSIAKTTIQFAAQHSIQG